MNEELCEKILNIINDNHNKTGGYSGLKPVELKLKLNIEYRQIRDVLNWLYENNKIKVRKGINSHLLFKI